MGAWVVCVLQRGLLGGVVASGCGLMDVSVMGSLWRGDAMFTDWSEGMEGGDLRGAQDVP